MLRPLFVTLACVLATVFAPVAGEVAVAGGDEGLTHEWGRLAPGWLDPTARARPQLAGSSPKLMARHHWRAPRPDTNERSTPPEPAVWAEGAPDLDALGRWQTDGG